MRGRVRNGSCGPPFDEIGRLHMERIAASAIVLDMDGVLLRTNDAKYRAMMGLFERHPEKAPGIVASEAMVDEYLVKYRHALEGVAVIAEWDNFVERTVVKLRDFTDPDTIKRCISEAAQANAI